MKIAFFSPFPPYRGGISNDSVNLYYEFIKEHEVDLYNFKRQYPSFLFPGKTQYIDNNQNTNFPSQRIIDIMNPLSWDLMVNKVIKNNYDVLVIRYWHPFFAFCYTWICKSIRKKNSHIKIVSLCDNIIPHEYFPLKKKLVKRYLDSLDGAITFSKNVQNELLAIKNNIDNKTLFLPIQKGLPEPMGYYDSQSKIGINNKFTLLFFGLIRPYKGLDIFLKSLSKIDKKYKNSFQFLIVGENYENNNKYFKLITKYNLANNVRWIDRFIPNSEISLYFSACDYVVIPYTEASQSAVIPMAYFYNKPIIVNNVTGINEQLIENKTGYIYNDDKELIEIIEDLIRNKDNSQMLLNDIIEYKESISTKKLCKNIIEFIDEI